MGKRGVSNFDSATLRPPEAYKPKLRAVQVPSDPDRVGLAKAPPAHLQDKNTLGLCFEHNQTSLTIFCKCSQLRASQGYSIIFGLV